MYTTIVNNLAYKHGRADRLMTYAPTSLPDGNHHTMLLDAGVNQPTASAPPVVLFDLSQPTRSVNIRLDDLRWLAGAMTPADGTRHELEGISLRKWELVSCYHGKVLRVVHVPVLQNHIPSRALSTPHVQAFLALPSFGGDKVQLEIGEHWAALHDPATKQGVYGFYKSGEAWPNCQHLLDFKYARQVPWPEGAGVLSAFNFDPTRFADVPLGTLHYSNQERGNVRINSTDGKRITVIALKGEDEE